MSADISYRRRAFHMTPKQAGGEAAIVFLLEEAGSSNCYETATRRARDWYCQVAGQAWECMGEVTRSAANCCGGTFRMDGTPHTEPEAYIRAWRKAIGESLPLAEAGREGFMLSLFVRISDEQATSSRKYSFEDLQAQTLVQAHPFGTAGGTEWIFCKSVPAEVRLWLKTREGLRGHQGVNVECGPR